VLTGTFGKAFGAGGAFVAGSHDLVRWLWNTARSFVFSTGLSPIAAAMATEGMRRAAADEGLRARTLRAADRMRAGLADRGLGPKGFGHIVPWVLGDSTRAMAVAAALRSAGVEVRAVRPPTVPRLTARIRFCLSAAHDERSIDHALAAIDLVLGQRVYDVAR
jgi:8-amino-7-oxononanoate synthase